MIHTFDFNPGRVFSRKYAVVSRLGTGWEGEVYKLVELETGIERAGKFFFPERNPRNKALRFYAKKLHKLRHCGILIHYNTQEQIRFRGQDISFLVSEYVEGVLLSEFIAKRPRKKLEVYQALHLLYSLSKGLECIHKMKEYHGDLHTYNIIVTRVGLDISLKLIDLFHWSGASSENIFNDVCDLIRILYDSLGGAKTYCHHPPEIRSIICGLKRSLIKRKFRTAGHLRNYLESLALNSHPG